MTFLRLTKWRYSSTPRLYRKARQYSTKNRSKKYNRDAIAFASPESLYGLIAPEFKDMPEEKLVYAIALAKNGAETTIEIGTRIKAVLKKPAWNESVCLLLSEERSKKS